MADYSTPVQHKEDVTTTGPTSFVGKVQMTIFEHGLFKILSVTVEDSKFTWDTKKITVKGQLGDVVPGDRYEFEGRVVDDRRYGLQFAASSCHVVLPKTPSQLTTYFRLHNLSIINLKGASKQIFNSLGENAVLELLNNPQKIHEVEELEKDDADKIEDFFASLDFGNTTSEIIGKLRRYNFSQNQINQIFDRYGVKTLNIIAANPYRLCIELSDNIFSFSRLDEIAKQFLHFGQHDPRRIRGAVLCSLKDITQQSGSTYTQWAEIADRASYLLGAGVENEELNTARKDLNRKKEIVEDNKGIYPASLYLSEQTIANKLVSLLDTGDNSFDEKEFESALAEAEADSGTKYDEIQVQAIKQALSHAVFLLTGGPGTGKTTIINGMVECWLKMHPDQSRSDIAMVAPTGRAAKQITAATNLEASTIHRLLGLTADINEHDLQKMHFESLKAQLIIVDEMSMTSTSLFAALISAVHTGSQLVLVGDCDQLPSVGPGQVFYDLLSVDKLPKIRLQHIYRQSKDSSIIDLARKINTGQVDNELFNPEDPAKYDHRRFYERTAGELAPTILQAVQLYTGKLKLSLMDIQILAPIHKGQAGTQYLNEYLQANLNPDDGEKNAIKTNYGVLRIGDKVMQTVNDPDRDVFNGDLGIISSIEGSATLHGNKKSKEKLRLGVTFGDQEVTYNLSQISALHLAYCMTIHKSQGSQSKVVILPMVNDYYPNREGAPTIMRRNLLYTAVTRSSQALMMIGQASAFVRCAMTPTQYRHTSLTDRVKEALANSSFKVDHPDSLKKSSQKIKEPPSDSNLTTGQDYLPFDKTKSKEISHKQTAASPKSSVKQAGSTLPDHLTAEAIEEGIIDPLIGMDGLKPTDF